MNARYVLGVGLLALAASTLVSTAANAQGLADVARKEEERRKAMGKPAAKPAKVYTNDNLTADFTTPVTVPPASMTTTAAAGSAPADASAKTAPDAAGGENTGANPDVKPININDRGEKYWRERSAVIRGALESTRQQVDAFQARVNALAGDPSEQRVIQLQLSNARAALESLQTEWDNFQINAKQQNVPDAWIR